MSQLTIEQAFQLASRHHGAGELAQAEALYRQILARQPQHAGALHHLGVIAHQTGRNDLAGDLIRQAVAIQGDFAEAYSNLGLVLWKTGQLYEAIAAYRQAIALNPRDPVAQYNLGIALRDNDRLDEAIAAYRQAIALKPDYPQAHSNLGDALRDKGQLDEAIAALGKAIGLQPNFPGAYNNLGNALMEMHQPDEAIAAYRQAIFLKPEFPEAHMNLGNSLKEKGQLDEAITAYRHAIALKADYADAYNNLGSALRESGQLDQAIATYRRAIALNSRSPTFRSNLGAALKDKGQLDEAIAAFRQAIALEPGFAEAHSHLGTTLKDKGQLDEAIAAFRQALVIDPDAFAARSNLLFSMHFHPDCDAQAIAEEHRLWNRQHAEPLKKFIRPHLNDHHPERRLRIGYISADFREHPVARFLLPLLAHHDKSQVEVFAYAGALVPDAVTDRLRCCTDGWRSMAGLSDARAADLIRQDQIDILVDLAGHTGGNRLLLMARKPAPVQVTYLGYPNTTGLTSIDYRLTDALADPPGETEALHCEQLVRLPDGIWCYAADPQAPPIASLPALARGTVTFGSFSQWPKINRDVLRLWARLLGQVPGSTLLLKDPSLSGSTVRNAAREILAGESVGEDRLRVLDCAPTHRQHLKLYGEMDIALDPFPYHGTTTTCEALWMGLPVITLAGRSHASRVGVSLLNRIGLGELVAQTPAQYLQIASSLAADLTRLRELRHGMRQRMEQSPLMDAPKLARNIEAAYRQMWRIWCADAGCARNVKILTADETG